MTTPARGLVFLEWILRNRDPKSIGFVPSGVLLEIINAVSQA